MGIACASAVEVGAGVAGRSAGVSIGSGTLLPGRGNGRGTGCRRCASLPAAAMTGLTTEGTAGAASAATRETANRLRVVMWPL